MLVKCNVCAGEYDTEQPGGLRYFHVCPPLSGAEARELLDRDQLELSPTDRRRLLDSAAADEKDPRSAAERTRVDELLDALAIPRPGARNENIRGLAGGGDPHDAIAHGVGYTKIGAEPAPPR